MTLLHVGVILLISLFSGLFISKKYRVCLFLIANILVIFWLQPVSPIRHLDFWLPLTGLFLVVIAWFTTQTSFDRRQTWLTIGMIASVFLVISLLRYLEPLCCITSSRPPSFFQILSIVIPLILLIFLVIRFSQANKFLTTILIVLIIGIFIILKTDILSYYFSKFLRSLSGQDQTLANSFDLRWIGFSYLAFRLLHYLRDYQTGKLPSHRLDEFFAYAFFFPAYTAGPIERFPRFLDNLHQPADNQSNHLHISGEDFYQGSLRVVAGIFKKFVLADTLAIIALSSQNAYQIKSAYWAWIILYAYAFRIYFDFSGYTDIAIGMGRLMSIQLPENFTAPYLKPNLSLFWNSWHITLAQWFRAYVFNPLTRSMRTAKFKLSPWLIILCAQLSTMILIGLWHGVTINFAFWGLWHGAGLFLHNRWSDWRKSHLFDWESKTWVKNIFSFSSWFITFNYVVLGWVWFALPSPQMTWHVINVLFGAK